MLRSAVHEAQRQAVEAVDKAKSDADDASREYSDAVDSFNCRARQ